MARQRIQPSAYASAGHAMRRPTRNTRSDDGSANIESQQMLALAHLLKNPKSEDKEVQQLRAKVASDQKSMNALLGERLQQAESVESRRRDELTAAIIEALKSSNRPTHGEISMFAGTEVAKSEIYASTTEMLTTSENLIKEYKRLDSMIEDLHDEQAEPIAAIWKQNIEATEEKLRTGARVALRDVKMVLGADVGSDEDVDVTMEHDGDGGEKELNYELQRSLRYAERGIKRMAKGLPYNEA